MDTTDSIQRATFWSLAAEIAAKIVVPITNIILARILVPEVFGIIATINLVVSFADTFSTAGFQKYIIQHEFSNKEILYKNATVAFWTNFSIAAIAWFIIVIFRYPITNIVGNQGYEFPLIIAALSLPLTSLSSIHEALFQRKLDFKVLFYLRLVVSFLPFLITIPLALFGMSYWSLIIGTLAGNIAKAVLLNLKSDWKPNLFYNFSLLKEMFSFSGWTLAESIAMWATSYIDILIISNKLGAYYTGLYKNSQSIVSSILSIITGATTTVLFSSLSRVQNNQKQFEYIFYNFQKKVAIFVLPIGVGIFYFNELITSILLGNQWMEAANFIGIWGLCTSLVCVFGTFSREAYRAKGKPLVSLLVQILHLAFVIPVCLYGVSKGFKTLTYVRSFAYLQIILLHMIFVKCFFKLSPLKMLKTVKEPILCSIIMGIVAKCFLTFFSTSYLLQFVYIFICAITYFLLLSFFKPYRKEILSFIRSVKLKIIKLTKTDKK